MFTQGFGEVITDLLTINPTIADLPSASAILDTSNYTFNAITYGKDAAGYNFHGHTVSSTDHIDEDSSLAASSYNSGILILRKYNSSGVQSASSYFFSSTYFELSSTYNSVPRFPSPYDVRLEVESTSTTNVSAFQYASAIPDLGHYPNVAARGDLSAVWNIVGAFPPSGNVGKYYVFSSNVDTLGKDFIFSATLSGVYNEFGLVDPSGYVKINEGSGFNSGLSSLTNTQGGALSGGPCVFSGTSNTPRSGNCTLAVVPQWGDAVALAAFGGVRHIGVWCLDLKAMLASGLMPPYSWNNLNNNRIYKLVSKVTFWDNLMSHEDAPTAASLAGLGAGLQYGINGGRTTLDNHGPTFVLKFTFT